ncbi:MAG: hydrogenase formation protein HypD [Sedimentisphaeraceae bacterium JB056]
MERSNSEKLVRIRDMLKGKPTFRLMEVCGTHTVSIMRSGLRSLLPDNLKLISGPGCPVCVTCQGYIDAAISLTEYPEVVVCTYGDMMRVPGTDTSLADRKAEGADVRVVYSPRDIIQFASEEPDKQFIFLAIGFETTIAATVAAILEAEKSKLDNFTILSSHKRLIPAMRYLLEDQKSMIDGFLCPGHVSVIIGSDIYKDIASQYHKPCVVAGFEPEQLIDSIYEAVKMLIEHDYGVYNEYQQIVKPKGNAKALDIIEKIFEPADSAWRAIGTIPMSGYKLRKEYERFDGAVKYNLDIEVDTPKNGCRCGDVIQGKLTPDQCPLFASKCTPANPFGPCMVSSEGTCAAWYRFNRGGHDNE